VLAGWARCCRPGLRGNGRRGAEADAWTAPSPAAAGGGDRAGAAGELPPHPDPEAVRGQAKRLQYALAILPDPDLLILDEPTVAMDVELRRGFWVSMRDFIAGGRTVLFATHYLDEADTEANRIVVLNDGRLAADGRADQIKDRVAGRGITLAGDRLDPAAVGGLAGLGKVEAFGARLHLHSTDSDATLRALLAAFPSAHDIEVTPTRLEDAFLALTATEV
jgi:ABC-2 type transport system ATP-binding protein